MMLTHHGTHGKLKLFHLEDGGFNHQRDYKYLADSSIETKYQKMINSSMSDNTDSSNMAVSEEQKLTLVDGAQTQLNGPRLKL